MKDFTNTVNGVNYAVQKILHLIKCILIYIRSKCILRCSGLFRSHIECCCVNHIKIKSHIGNPVTSTDINRIFLINIHILTSDILMHKIKILKLILQLLLQTKLNCTTYINQLIFAATLFYYIHVLAMKWLALNYSCNGAESKMSTIYMHSSSFS